MTYKIHETVHRVSLTPHTDCQSIDSYDSNSVRPSTESDLYCGLIADPYMHITQRGFPTRNGDIRHQLTNKADVTEHLSLGLCEIISLLIGESVSSIVRRRDLSSILKLILTLG